MKSSRFSSRFPRRQSKSHKIEPMLISVPVSRLSPEERKNDVDDILDWIRSKKDDLKYRTGEIKKAEQLLPQKSIQMRNNCVKPRYGPLSIFGRF